MTPKPIVAVTLIMILSVSLAFAGSYSGKTYFKNDRNAPASIQPASLSMQAGQTISLSSAFTVRDPFGEIVTAPMIWSTSNTGIAKVENGMLIGVSGGGPISLTATIPDMSAVAQITVQPSQNPNYYTGGSMTNGADVAQDSQGNQWWVDQNGNIYKYVSDGTGYTYASCWTGLLSPTTSGPRHTTIYNGKLYVTDGLNLNQIAVIDLATGTVSTIGCGSFVGKAGELAVDENGNLRVADVASYPDSQIRVFDATTGQEKTPMGAGLIENPAGIATIGDFSYIADKDQHKILKFNNLTGYQVGEYLGSELSSPVALAIKGNTLGIVDNGAKKLLIYNLSTWQKIAETSYSGNLSTLTVDSDWKWIAADPQSGNCLVFSFVGQ